MTDEKNNINILRRKVDRPEYEVLLKEIDELGFSATGRKYGVSDNSIRKWVKNYEKYKITRGSVEIQK
jgi:transposase-like protein